MSALSLVLVFCMLLGVGPITPVAFAAETIASSVTDNGGHSQTHTAGTDLAAIQAQNEKWATQDPIFLKQCATALDGSDGNPDLCIPGLSSTDNMIPQGMTWYKVKDWALIASYDAGESRSSVVYALEIETGKFVAQFNLQNTNGSNLVEHVGGIAASDHNLYIATSGNKIGYIPLSELDVSEGTVKTVKIVDEVSIAELGGASTSYVSIDNGVLWLGNFYNSDYPTKAHSTYNSMIFGYYLQGSTSESEWAAFKSGSVAGSTITEHCAGHPSYTIAVDNEIDEIQCALIVNGKMYLGCSYGRKNASQLYVADIDLSKSGTINLTLKNGVNVNAYSTAGYREFSNLYMNEGMFERNNEIYILTESAAYKYRNGDGKGSCSYPTDVIWRLDPYALLGLSAPNDASTTTYYQKLNTINQITEGDEYIILYQSTQKAANGKNILYALNARGGYNGAVLPQYTVSAEATKDNTGDSMGMIGHAITDYEFVNGNARLILNNSEDDVAAIRWNIEKDTSVSDGTGVRLFSTDDYFNKAPYLYFGSRLMIMTYGTTERFKQLRISCENEANGSFRLYYQGNTSSKKYWMFCNDGSMNNTLSYYTDTYTQLSAGANYQTVYDGCEEVAGTFHMDGGNLRGSDADDTGNKMGGVNKATDIDASYGYFNIYKRIVKQETTVGKSNLFTGKDAYVAADGTYSIDLEAYATGATQSAETSLPLDVVVVMDLSGSITEKDCTIYEKNYRLSYNTATGDYYYKYGDDYYKINRGSKAVTEIQPCNYNLSHDNAVAGETKYYKLNGKYYPIKNYSVKSGNKTRYSIYIEDDAGDKWFLYNYDPDCKNKTTGHDDDMHPAHKYVGVNAASGGFPTYDEFESQTSGVGWCYRGNSNDSGFLLLNDITTYHDVTLATYYYLYIDINGTRYYLDGNGVAEKMPETTTKNDDIIYTGAYYKKNTSATRREAAIASLQDFIAQLRVDAERYGVDHRIALTTFGNNDSWYTALITDKYQNTCVWYETNTSNGDGNLIRQNDNNIQKAYDAAFHGINELTVDKGLTIISEQKVSNVGTSPQNGLEMAYNILTSNANTEKTKYATNERKAVVLFITDGVPGSGEITANKLNEATAGAASSIEWANKIKNNASAEVYSILIGATGSVNNFSDVDYMEGVSSNFPNATTYGSNGDRASQKYYYNAKSSTNELAIIMEDITFDAVTSGTSVSLDEKSVLKDVLSDDFTFPENLEEVEVALKLQKLSYDISGKLVEGDITDAPNTITWNIPEGSNEINITGFDYSENYVAPGKDGYMLIVSIKGVLPKNQISGYEIDTNDNERSGIYANPDSAEPEQLLAEDVTKLFPAPETSIPVYNYVFDFSSEMSISAISNQLLAVSEEPGKLDATNDYANEKTATNAQGGSASVKSNEVINLTTAAQDSHLYCFMKTNEEGVYQWAKVNLIPASNVYFEETALTNLGGDKVNWTTVGTPSTATQAVSSNADIYGYDASYLTATNTFSGGSAYKAVLDSTNRSSNTIIFSFTGEGFDLISACGPNTGVLAVKVTGKETGSSYNQARYFIVDTYYSDADFLVDGLMHSVPVMRFNIGNYDTYTVEITASYMNNAGAVKNAKSGGVSALSLDDGSDSSLDSMLKAAGLDEFVGKNVETIWMDDNSVLNGGTGNTGSQSTRPFSWLKAARGVATLAEEVVPQQLETYVDAVRIYKPYGNNDPEQYSTSERNSRYINVLDALKNGDAVASDLSESLYYFEQRETEEGVTFDFTNYESSTFGGPQNEIYLQPGCGITFTLTDYDPAQSAVMVALRRITTTTEGSLDCLVNGSPLKEGSITSTNEIYYNISAVVGGTVTPAGDAPISIVNNSENEILAISYIKLVDATIASDLSLDDAAVAVRTAYNSRAVSFNPFEVYEYTGTGDEDESFNDNNIPSIVDMSFFEEIIAMLERIFKLIFGISTIVK